MVDWVGVVMRGAYPEMFGAGLWLESIRPIKDDFSRFAGQDHLEAFQNSEKW